MPILGFACFQSELMDKNKIFSEMKIQQCIQNDVVVNFNDAIRIRHCALNIESKQPVAFLTLGWTSLVRESKNAKQFYSVVLKMPGWND